VHSFLRIITTSYALLYYKSSLKSSTYAGFVSVKQALNISNKYLYYIDKPGTKFGGDIVRVDKDGSNKVVLLEGDFFGLTMINEYLYFIDNNEYRMYRMKSDGTDLTLFSIDNCDLFFYDLPCKK
jgi:hypothetical protein